MRRKKKSQQNWKQTKVIQFKNHHYTRGQTIMQEDQKLYSGKELTTMFWMLKRVNYNAAILEECERPFTATVTEMSQGIYVF